MAAWSWCERYFTWNVALRLSVGRWEQEEDVEAVAGQQVGSVIQQIYFTIHSDHICYPNLDKRALDLRNR